MYFELKHHGPHLKGIVDDQHSRLGEAQEKISKVEEKQSNLEDRIAQAIQQHSFLEERLKRLRNLPGAHKKPLSKAERDFKSELGSVPVFSLQNLVWLILLDLIFNCWDLIPFSFKILTVRELVVNLCLKISQTFIFSVAILPFQN